jgi:hypothetical protein
MPSIRQQRDRAAQRSGVLHCENASRHSISAIVCSVSISVSLSSMSVAFVKRGGIRMSWVRASERPTPDLHKQQ